MKILHQKIKILPLKNDNFVATRCLEALKASGVRPHSGLAGKQCDFCIKNDEFCVKADGFCIKMMVFVLKMMNPPGRHRSR